MTSFFCQFDHVLHHESLEVNGLIFSHYQDNRNQLAIFNSHTNTWYKIPPPPKIYETSIDILGMVVDTNEAPYTFKLIMGSTYFNTQSYDSKNGLWTTKSSCIPNSMICTRRSHLQSVTCLYANGYIYINGHSWQDDNTILMYSIDRDLWTSLKEPPSYHCSDKCIYHIQNLGI